MNVLKRLYSRINHMNPKQETCQYWNLFWATMAAYYPFVVVFYKPRG